jgi:hypothetical protein
MIAGEVNWIILFGKQNDKLRLYFVPGNNRF